MIKKIKNNIKRKNVATVEREREREQNSIKMKKE